MSHEIELDYAEIQENLDLSQLLGDYVTKHDVEDYASEYAEDAFQMFKDEIGDFSSELDAQLDQFVNGSHPCKTGRLFIDAVEKAQRWNGEEYSSVGEYSSPYTDLKREVRIVLRDILSELVIGKADDATSND